MKTTPRAIQRWQSRVTRQDITFPALTHQTFSSPSGMKTNRLLWLLDIKEKLEQTGARKTREPGTSRKIDSTAVLSFKLINPISVWVHVNKLCSTLLAHMHKQTHESKYNGKSRKSSRLKDVIVPPTVILVKLNSAKAFVPQTPCEVSLPTKELHKPVNLSTGLLSWSKMVHI